MVFVAVDVVVGDGFFGYVGVVGDGGCVVLVVFLFWFFVG